MGRLAGKIVIITGAAQGMGEATARLFAAEGASLCLTDIKPDGAAVAAALGETAMFLRHDVTDEARWAEVAQAAVARFGRVDVLINNAGIVHAGSILEIAKADFSRVIEVNLLSAWLGIKHVAPAIIAAGGGAIVNIASISGLTAINGLAAYASSKWGLRGLSRVAAMELGPKKVRVNTILPGTINTEMGNVAHESEEDLNARQRRLPIARVGRPDEVARASLYLASDDASYLTGSEIVVDGGLTAGFYSDALPNGVD